jgi:hypothetical protein
MRIVPTPIVAPAVWPSPMPGGFDPALAPAIIAGPGQEALCARLAEPDVLVVTTGQQPALFTGPLYAVHKALSAAALAQVLSQRWGRSVVPLFWVAGDDHDFAEANHAAWLRPDGSLHVETLRIAQPTPPPAHVPQPLGAGLNRLRAGGDLAAATGIRRCLWLRAHFRPEATLAVQRRRVADLLRPACSADGSTRLMRGSARGARALEEASGLRRPRVRCAALRRRAEPGRPGGDGPRSSGPGKEGRDRLVMNGAGFRARHGASGTPENPRPARPGTGPLLRQRAPASRARAVRAPTVAYVAGRANSFWPCRAVYAQLGVSPQLPVPRWSGMLVEPRVDRVLAKFGASLEELLAPGARLESRVARERLPAEAVEAITVLRASIDREYDAIEAAAIGIDPTLQRPIRGLKGCAGAPDTVRRPEDFCSRTAKPWL